MGKKRKSRYLVIDLGNNNLTDELVNDKNCTLALEVQRENCNNPYTRYYVQRVLPCRFEGGKLYKS